MNNYHEHWRIFFFVLDKLADQGDIYRNLKNNEEEKNNSNYFGLQAVKYNIFYFILMAAVAGLTIGACAFFMASGVWQGILMIVAAIVILPYTVIFFILALNCDIKQMKLNKKPIGLVSLLFTLFILIAAIVSVVITALVLSV